MTSDQFCYWLQGFFELKKTIDHRDGATPETMKMIEDHLQTVFKKVTPEVEQAKKLLSDNEESLKRLDEFFGHQHKWLQKTGEGVQIIC